MWMSSCTRQGCLWGSIYTAAVSCSFLGQMLFGSAGVLSGEYFTLALAAATAVSCGWYGEMRLISKPSSIFAQYVHREYRIHLFSSPVVVAVFCCETNHKPPFCGFHGQVIRGPARVSGSKCGLVASRGQSGRQCRHSSTYRT